MTMATQAFSTDDVTIDTPRGAKVNLKIHKGAGANLPLLVVAPGQGCKWMGPVFETLATQSADRGYVVVRFNWNYCNSNPDVPEPSVDYVNEIEDFNAVLQFAMSLPGIDGNRVNLAGKSLGSIVGQRIFTAHPELKALALLTPVCSHEVDEHGIPYPAPRPVTDESYPGLKSETRQVLMAGGSRDSLCFLPIFYQYLGDSKGNITTAIFGGDHGLSINDKDGNVDQARTKVNIDAFVAAILNWLDLQN